MSEPRLILESLFHAGVEACMPSRVLAAHLPPRPKGRLIVLAAGKSAVEMAEVVEGAWDGPMDGVVVARPGQTRDLKRLTLMEAPHPTPDERSVAAGLALLTAAAKAGADDQVLVLLSGGASSLLCLPGEGLTLAAKQALTRDLLRSGAPIQDMNLVRRHLSRVKGGRLAAAAWPAPVLTLAISDVVSDAPEAIGSGPTVADPSTVAEAKALLARHGIRDPGAGWSETVKPGDPRLARAEFRIVASARTALAAVVEAARRAGFVPEMLGEGIEGEAREVGAAHALVARAYAGRRIRHALISGGELTVTVGGQGRGGPNQEYAAVLALALEGASGVYALAGDSDGIDGSSGAAGAFITPDTLARARKLGVDLMLRLASNDVAPAFEALGDAFAPGATGSNVNDLRIVLVGA